MLSRYRMKRQQLLPTATVFLTATLIALRGFRDYAPLTEGWWHVYVQWINQGKVPYKDFELLVPPGYPYILRIVTAVFGGDFLILRILGSIQIGLISVSVYALIQSLCGRSAAIPLAVLTSGLLSSGTAFLSYDYVYSGLLFMLGAFTGAINWHAVGRPFTERTFRVNVLIGVSVGMCLSIKQSQGLWALVGTLLIVSILRWGDGVGVLRHLAHIGIGVGTVWIPLLVWLLLSGVSPLDFAEDVVLLSGPKGSLLEMLFGWVRDVLTYDGVASPRSTVAALILIVQGITPLIFIALLLRWGINHHTMRRQELTKFVVFGTIIAVFIWVLLGPPTGAFGKLLEFLASESVSLAPVGSTVALSLSFLIACFSSDTFSNRRKTMTICVAAISVVWAGAMSAGISEIGYFLAVVVALATFVAVARRHLLAVLLVGLISVALISSGWSTKDKTTFAWWSYSTPSRSEATSTFRDGLMRGLRTTQSIAFARTRLQEFLMASEGCPGQVVAFPHIPVFLLDLKLTPNGRTAQYWYDFTTVSAIEEEIVRLEQTEVKAILLMELPRQVEEMHEELFNEGKPLPHRELQELLLSRSSSMTLIVSESLSQDSHLKAWVTDCVVASRMQGVSKQEQSEKSSFSSETP